MIKELKMYKRFSDKNYDYFLLFTLLFAVSYLVSQIWLVSAGKSLVYGDDALSIYYEILQYRKSLFQNFVTDLFIMEHLLFHGIIIIYHKMIICSVLWDSKFLIFLYCLQINQSLNSCLVL